MSLMKLLTVSKSFAGGRNQPGRYKMAEQGLLPKFAPMGRPVSLAPTRQSDEPASKQKATIPLNSLQQQFFSAADPVARPVRAVVPMAQAATCGNAVVARTNWFRLGNSPFVNPPAGRPKSPELAQAELSLDAVKPVRNDLSDS